MTSTRMRSAIALCLFVSLTLAVTWSKPADTREADSAAVKKLFNDFNDTFNNHDAHGVAARYSLSGHGQLVGACWRRST